jgi:O-antigen/teichoic acid export membrane protein
VSHVSIGAVGARYTRVATALVASVITARSLGPSGRGEYFFVLAAAGLVAHFGGLGMHATNMYQAARDRRLVTPLASNSLVASVVIGVVGGGASVLVFAHVTTTTHDQTSFIVIPLLGATTLFFLLGTHLLIGTNRVSAFNVFETLSNIAALLLIGLAAVLWPDLSGFLWATFLVWFVTAIVLAANLLGTARGGFRPSLSVFRTGFRYAAKAYFVSLCGYLLFRANIFLLAHLQSSADVGYFSIAAQMSDTLTLLPATIALVLFPKLVQDQKSGWRVATRQALLVGSGMCVICVIVAVVAEPFIVFTFGPAYEPAVPIIRWMLPGIVAVSVTTSLSQYVAAIGFPLTVTLAWAIAVVILVSLAAVLIPNHAGTGAAVASSISYLALLAMILVIGVRHRTD